MGLLTIQLCYQAFWLIAEANLLSKDTYINGKFREQNLKETPQNLMKVVNANAVRLTSQLMTSYKKTNIAKGKNTLYFNIF